VQVEWTPKFKKRFEKKDAKRQAAVAECIARVEEAVENPGGPRSSGLRLKQVGKRTWYARVDLSNRLAFEIDTDGVLVLLNHCHKEAVLESLR
jgi:mRNA-degrading endonuclease RelE of RelBE toxin-antitoxin system